MPEPLNLRDHVEYAPSVSADGRTLIFQSDRYGVFVNAYKKVPRINAEGDQQLIDDKLSTQFFGVYEARLHPSGQWMKPEPIQAINRYDSDSMTPLIGGPGISYDGNYLFFFANFPTKPGFGREDIYYCVRQRNGWGPPVNIGPAINTAGYEGFPSISADGRQLYFVRENLTHRSHEGQTCYRIMVAEKGRDGQWKRPIELPAPVNMDCEKAPRILADSRTLVYSSIKAKGDGDFDLYMSVLQADGSWSAPKNLHYVNTKRSDQSVAISACGDLMYYVSDGDMYTTPIPDELRPFKLATVQGFVTDSLSGLPVSARVVVNDVGTGQLVTTVETNPADGRYTVLLPSTSAYRLTVNERDFRTASRLITWAAYVTCDVIPTDFRLKPIRTETAARPDATLSRKADDIVIVAAPVVERVTAAQVADKRTEEVTLVDSVRQPKPSPLIVVQVRVVDSETGAAIPNAQLTITDEKTQKPLTASPDSTGQGFALSVMPGTSLGFRTTAPDYLITNAKLNNITAPQRLTLKLLRQKPSVLTIRAFAMTIRQPLTSAVASITSKSIGQTERFDMPGGRLERTFVNPDDLTIQISAPGYTSVTRQLTIDVPPGGKFYEFDAELDAIVTMVAKPPVAAPPPAPIATTPEPATVAETVTASVSAVTTKAFGVVEKGKSIRLNRLYFDQSSPVLRPESYTELDQLFDLLTQYPTMRIEIRGHTDNQGDFDANVQLSRDRCQAVVDYLAGKGIRKTRLKAVGRGPTEPVAPNNSEENRKKNRRVEFVVI
ncbi:OmpA family protein [Spirosoma montaniterrae]|uniref:OmpA-like domain-containing protein n=1 Tax=Spirosoma montaniterrae TaxID=1178516 RepID=A0A1P9WXW6_9BACT|nr:OmpA family protein [Spirosoma montaniterrae]AQG80214.1 hypothetical protein AWR27_13340 [Spirosoma montaniterrae]